VTYKEAFDYLVSSYTTGKKRGFEDLRLFLGQFGDPQEKIPTVHVAGTNGKGSVCAMLAHILREQGNRVGLFTSPDLHKFNERMMINNIPISDGDFARYMLIVKETTEKLFGDAVLSYYQILMLMAYLYFYDNKIDYLVLETGIGGRLDSTNIVTAPLLSVITSIGFDHMDVLGDTIEKIAAEKSGIIKKNRPVVLYYQGELVYNVVKQAAKGLDAELFYSPFDFRLHKNDLTGMEFSAESGYYSYPLIKLGLLGEYQIYNTAAVLTAVCALRQYGVQIDERCVLQGLEKTVWPGRMEVIRYKQRTIILEGAHNACGAAQLVRNMRGYVTEKHRVKKITLLAAVMRDKEYGKMLGPLADISETIVLTKPHYGVRAASVAKLFDSVNAADRAGKNIITERDCRRALDIALKLTDENDVILCTGSLYLVGDIRAVLLGLGDRG
jgi:dihydrofolate synthase/folylpolyglutamate synthase